MDEPPSPARIVIEIAQRQSSRLVESERWREWLADLLQTEGVVRGEVSVVVVDHLEMRQLNRDYLQHDYPTDVLSFVFEHTAGSVSGEVVVSAEMARDRAGEFGWSADAELALYLIHGALHLVGYRDKSKSDARLMREREQFYLERFGIAHASAAQLAVGNSSRGASRS